MEAIRFRDVNWGREKPCCQVGGGSPFCGERTGKEGKREQHRFAQEKLP